MINLDSLKTISQLDPSRIREFISLLPEHIDQTWTNLARTKLPKEYQKIKKIIICGMGGSAIGADLVKSFAQLRSQIPITIVRNYELPGWIDEETLVLLISCSGNTDEVLHALNQAKAQKAKIFIITKNGELKKIAEEEKLPSFIFNYQGPSRTAIGFTSTATLQIFSKLKIISVEKEDIDELVNFLKEQNKILYEKAPADINPAKQLASKLHQKILISIGSGIFSVCAKRFADQLAENSKNLAFFLPFPELVHNFIEGIENPPFLLKNLFLLIFQSSFDHPRVSIGFDILKEIFSKKNLDFKIIHAQGKTLLAQLFYLILLTDWTSFYLALLNGTDPFITPSISNFKDNLKEF